MLEFHPISGGKYVCNIQVAHSTLPLIFKGNTCEWPKIVSNFGKGCRVISGAEFIIL
jgi:hypothetical protein